MFYNSGKSFYVTETEHGAKYKVGEIGIERWAPNEMAALLEGTLDQDHVQRLAHLSCCQPEYGVVIGIGCHHRVQHWGRYVVR